MPFRQLIEELEFFSIQRELIDFFIYISEHFMKLYHKTSKINLSLEFKQVFNYIDTNLFKKINLQDIADTINMSKTYLSTKFKKETGIGLNQYILERRIEEAKKMLLFTNYTFQDISTKLNFSSQSYFIKCFKDVTRQTPQEFKNDHWQYNIWH